MMVWNKGATCLSGYQSLGICRALISRRQVHGKLLEGFTMGTLNEGNCLAPSSPTANGGSAPANAKENWVLCMGGSTLPGGGTGGGGGGGTAGSGCRKTGYYDKNGSCDALVSIKHS